MVKAWVLESYIQSALYDQRPLVAFSDSFARKFQVILNAYGYRVTNIVKRPGARITQCNFPFVTEDHPHRAHGVVNGPCVRCDTPITGLKAKAPASYIEFHLRGPLLTSVDICGANCMCDISETDTYILLNWEKTPVNTDSIFNSPQRCEAVSALPSVQPLS